MHLSYLSVVSIAARSRSVSHTMYNKGSIHSRTAFTLWIAAAAAGALCQTLNLIKGIHLLFLLLELLYSAIFHRACDSVRRGRGRSSLLSETESESRFLWRQPYSYNKCHVLEIQCSNQWRGLKIESIEAYTEFAALLFCVIYYIKRMTMSVFNSRHFFSAAFFPYYLAIYTRLGRSDVSYWLLAADSSSSNHQKYVCVHVSKYKISLYKGCWCRCRATRISCLMTINSFK